MPLAQKDGDGIALVRKPTGFMTNSLEIDRQLERKCDGMHRHIVLVGGRAKQAEVYPEELCKGILKGLMDQMNIMA